MDRRAFIGALGLGALGGAACTRPAIVHANSNRDGINYSARGGYADLDFAALGGVYMSPAHTGPRLGKIGGRWVFVDPFGKVLILRALYRTSADQTKAIGGGQQAGRTLKNNIIAKYGSVGNWREAMKQRLKTFHFNGVGTASLDFIPGIAADFQRAEIRDTGQYSKHPPYVQSVGIREPVKDITRACKANAPGVASMGWRSSGLSARGWGDWFDPKYTQFVNATWKYSQDDNIIYFQQDDGDYTSIALGAGHPNETGFQPVGLNWCPHIGMCIMWSPLTITSAINARDGSTITWTQDTLNHSKRKLLDNLIAKYGTISALNAAWGTGGYYTSFDSAGGWGTGTGLADEDGLRPRPWFGSNGPAHYGHLAGENCVVDSTVWNANVKVDLDEMLRQSVEAWIKPTRTRLRSLLPGALFTCSTGIGNRGGPARISVCQAIRPYIDLVFGGGHGSGAGSQYRVSQGDAIMNYYRQHIGDKPFVQQFYWPNNDDGSMYYVPRGDGTQTDRGKAINQRISYLMTFQNADGIYPYVGYIFWAAYDQPNEQTGWGIFSYNDNPYDGRDYRVAQPDPYTPGRITLTEDRVYGDAITPIKNAHIAQFRTLQTNFGR